MNVDKGGGNTELANSRWLSILRPSKIPSSSRHIWWCSRLQTQKIQLPRYNGISRPSLLDIKYPAPCSWKSFQIAFPLLSKRLNEKKNGSLYLSPLFSLNSSRQKTGLLFSSASPLLAWKRETVFRVGSSFFILPLWVTSLPSFAAFICDIWLRLFLLPFFFFFSPDVLGLLSFYFNTPGKWGAYKWKGE